VVLAVAMQANGRAEAATTELVSVAADGSQANGPSGSPSINSSGRFVAFDSWADNLVPSDRNSRVDVFVRDLAGGRTERISVNSNGVEGNKGGAFPYVSATGRFVTFISGSTNLASPGTSWVEANVFIRDRLTGITELANVGIDGQPARPPSTPTKSPVSSDGRYVAFVTRSSLLPDDTNGLEDVYLRDRFLGVLERVSVDSSGHQSVTNHSDGSLAMSPDGRFIAFGSRARDLSPGDDDSLPDLFVRDRLRGITEIISGGVKGGVSGGLISDKGRFVVFGQSGSTYIHDRTKGVTQTHIGVGSPSSMTSDGRFIAVWDRSAGVSVLDRITRSTERVDLDTCGVPANDMSFAPSISGNGRRVAFFSVATNLVPNDTNYAEDVFVHLLARGHRAHGRHERCPETGEPGSRSDDGRADVGHTCCAVPVLTNIGG
jgi:Tol biopolymer transport system component